MNARSISKQTLTVAADAGLDQASAGAWLDSTSGMADVWAEQARAWALNVRRVPHVLVQGAPGPVWPWDPWNLAGTIRGAADLLQPAPRASAPDHGERFGFARTRCGCDFCRVYCRHIPGRLAVGDLAALCPDGADVFAWAEEHLQAVVDTPYPKLVPARQDNRHCHWYANGACTVHDRAPYGCAFFDSHMTSTEVRTRGLPANVAAVDDASAGGLHFRVWRHLVERGRTRRSGQRGPVDHEMRLLRLSIDFG